MYQQEVVCFFWLCGWDVKVHYCLVLRWQSDSTIIYEQKNMKLNECNAMKIMSIISKTTLNFRTGSFILLGLLFFMHFVDHQVHHRVSKECEDLMLVKTKVIFSLNLQAHKYNKIDSCNQVNYKQTKLPQPPAIALNHRDLCIWHSVVTLVWVDSSALADYPKNLACFFEQISNSWRQDLGQSQKSCRHLTFWQFQWRTETMWRYTLLWKQTEDTETRRETPALVALLIFWVEGTHHQSDFM